MLAPMGVGFPCLIGYRCLAMPSDKHSGFSLHLFCVYNLIEKWNITRKENLRTMVVYLV